MGSNPVAVIFPRLSSQSKQILNKVSARKCLIFDLTKDYRNSEFTHWNVLHLLQISSNAYWNLIFPLCAYSTCTILNLIRPALVVHTKAEVSCQVAENNTWNQERKVLKF